MILTSGSNGLLAVKLSRESGVPFHIIELDRLKYGEKYVRLTFDVSGEEVFLVNTFHPNPDEIIVENLFIAETLREYGARKVYGIFPYIAYSKKGKKLIRGEISPLKVVAKAYSGAFDGIYSVDFSGELEVVNLTAADLIADHFSNVLKEKTVVISPDEASKGLVERIAERLGLEYELMKKVRVDAENVIVTFKKLDLSGYDVLLVDDLIYTGSSMVQAIKHVRRNGARRVYVSCTHALADRRDLLNIYLSGAEEIVATDTVLSPVSKLSVSKIICEAVF